MPPTLPNPKKIAVALAAAGCACGCGPKTVERAPGPLVCVDVATQMLFGSTAEVPAGTNQLQFTALATYAGVEWNTIDVVDIVGGSLGLVTHLDDPPTVSISFDLDAPPPTSVSFSVNATVDDYGSTACPIVQPFTITIDDTGQASIATNDRLPLPFGSRHRAAIAMHRSTGDFWPKPVSTRRGS
jgi:hypothetical protein